ncbi:MAG: T9SS type A sorting domain-containing protein [Thermonemataceae bacterium]|nr:T9SS type A sorting domain-containing protein [Thermonemataceae bacterium]
MIFLEKKYLRIIGLIFILSLKKVSLYAQCDFYEDITVSTSGYNSGAGFTQRYVLVENNAGTPGEILDINANGQFLGLASGSYFVYAVNYQGTQPATLAAGSQWSAFTGALGSSCVALTDAYLGRAVNVCNIDQTACLTSNIQVSTSGYTSTAGFSQNFILVNSTTNQILATNTTGVFTPADYGGVAGVFNVYAVNTNSTNVTNTMITGDPFNNVSVACTTYCASLLGPRVVEVSTCTPLDAQLLNFNGNAQEGYDFLEWQIKQDKNMQYFILEASADGQNFQRIAQVNKKEENTEIAAYNYLHKTPFNFITYYRLKVVSDNKTAYSNIISIGREGLAGEIKLYPNPAKDYFVVEIPSDTNAAISMEIIDILGKSIEKRYAQLKQGFNKYTFDTSALPSATYVLKIRTDKQIFSPIKLVLSK